jgi:hypothetical protein
VRFIAVIRGVDDEAALILASGSIATAISRLAVRLFSNKKVVWFFIFGTVFFHDLNLLNGYLPGWLYHYLFQPGFFALTSFVCFFLLAPGLFNCVFGAEFLIGAARCEIAHDSAPDSARARIVTLKTPDQKPSGQNSASSASNMHHRIYNYPSCGQEIVKWITERVRWPSPSDQATYSLASSSRNNSSS